MYIESMENQIASTDNKIDEIDDAGTVENGSEANAVYPANVNIARDQKSLFELKRKMENSFLILDPEFQRNFVWSGVQKAELIEWQTTIIHCF